MSLYRESNYLNKSLDYLISSYIREYDISKANINILLYKKLITLDQYNFYLNLDRDDRQKQVGLLQKYNTQINRGLNEGFKEVMEMFFKANNIQDHEVLAIKKDAIYLINKIAPVVDFENIHFRTKLYTSYYKIKNLKLYYFADNVTNTEYLDVDGISNKILPIHKDFFLEFLLVVFNSAQTDTIEETINIIQTFYHQYINFELDLGYYRTFNVESVYIFKPISNFGQFKAEHLREDQKICLDISHNASLIQELYKIYTSIHFSIKNKR